MYWCKYGCIYFCFKVNSSTLKKCLCLTLNIEKKTVSKYASLTCKHYKIHVGILDKTGIK